MSSEDEDVTGFQPASPTVSRATANSLRSVTHIESSIGRDVKKSEDADDRAQTNILHRYYKIIWGLVWPDLILSNLKWSSLRIVFRSWLMMWSLTLLCIIGGPAEFMGPSSFLANFSGGIEIAGNLSVSAAFVSCMSDLITVIFAFTISVVTMGINHRLHGYPTAHGLIEELVQAGRCDANRLPTFDNCLLPHVYQGYFLKTRTTVITIFGMLFSFGMCGYFQTKSKYGKLQWLLNSLFTIVVFSFNNMTPLWTPWFYAKNVIKPMVMAFSFRFAVSLFILPFSSNKHVTKQMATACRQLKATISKLTSPTTFATPKNPDFLTAYDFIRSETQLTFAKHIVNEMDMEMVDRIEVTLSYFERPDLSELRSLVRLIMSALSSFHFFYEEFGDRKLDIIEGQRETVRKHVFKSDRVKNHTRMPRWLSEKLKKTYKETGSYEFERKHQIQQLLSSWQPTISLDQLEDEFLDITKKYDPLLRTAADLLVCIADWLDASTFWSFREDPRQKFYEPMKNSLLSLVALLKENPHESHVDEHWALHGFVCMHFARRVARLGSWCVGMQKQRPNVRFTWPFKHARMSTSEADAEDLDFDGERSIFGGSAPERSYAGFQPMVNVEPRDPDSTPPRRWYHLFGAMLLKVARTIYDPDLIFSVKRAGLIVITLIPYFCRTTAFFAYRHWFLWVAVLTSYTVAQQAVDGVYGLLAKFVFNFFGCLVGMVAWYISAGSGRGNPYGYAVVTAFVWIYIAFVRQFNKHFIPATSIVYACTVTLVLGNSWSNGHILLPGLELGKGFSVAWVRFVTVSVGITISFIGTIFPYPYTAKLAVREIIGSCIERLGDLQSSISNFGMHRCNDSDIHIVAHSDYITTAARAVITNLGSAEMLRRRLVYEPPLAGVYPTHRYKLLIKYVYDIAQLYTLLYSLLDEIEDVSKIPQVLHATGWTHPALSTDIYSVVYMSCRALVDGKALPAMTAAHLAESYIHEIVNKDLNMSDAALVDPAMLSAIALGLQIYKRFDGVVILIKELVGEVYDVNIDIINFEKHPLMGP